MLASTTERRPQQPKGAADPAAAAALSPQTQRAVLDFLGEDDGGAGDDSALKALEDEVFLFEWPLEPLNDQALVLDALNLYFLVVNPVANVALPVLPAVPAR